MVSNETSAVLDSGHLSRAHLLTLSPLLEGNKRYNRLIQANKVRYMMLTKNEYKGMFLKAIQSKLCKDEGRKFLELDSSGTWQKASKQRIREKIRTALSDAKLKNALKIGPQVIWHGPDLMDPFEGEYLEEGPLDDFLEGQELVEDSSHLPEDAVEPPDANPWDPVDVLSDGEAEAP